MLNFEKKMQLHVISAKNKKILISCKIAILKPFDPFKKTVNFTKIMLGVTFVAFFKRNHSQKNPSKSDDNKNFI